MQFLTSIPDFLRGLLLYNEDAALTFTRLSFWIFFAAVMLLYTIFHAQSTIVRSTYLLAVSTFFYYKASGFDFTLLLFTALFNYTIAHCIHLCTNKGRRVWLIVGITINLLLLAYFKYADYAVSTINELFGTNFYAKNLFAALYNNYSASTRFDASQIVLPIGISFYIFQAISYIIDVYRRCTAPVRSLLNFGFYISFFPQLVAGPIVRANEFIPQIYRKYQLSQREFWSAIVLIMSGLVKKIIVSDYIAFNYVDRIFDEPTLYTGFELLTGAYGYAIQIYCDFSGYTDIAIGVAAILGFQLPINFRAPYLAHSMHDFWRRWHISLSTWLRDYLYIPLGGNRKSTRRTYLNLLITMLLGGLWHGANYKFILWGALHGLLLISGRFVRTFIPPWIQLPRIVGTILTFHAVCLLWIFFRADSTETALTYIYRTFNYFQTNTIHSILAGYTPIFVVMTMAYILHFLPVAWKSWIKNQFVLLPVGIKIILIVALIFLMLQVSSSATQPFIYFQF